MNKYNELSGEERITKEIVDCAFKVHSNLGPAYLKEYMKLVFVTN